MDADRQERRERKVMAISVSSLVLSAVALALVVDQAVLPKHVVEASVFCLRGREGNVRASLQELVDGTLSFAMGDWQGTTRVALGVARNGAPGLVLRDASGAERAWVQLDEGGEPRLWLSDASATPRLTAGVVENGSGLWLVDKDNKLGAFMSLDDREGGWIALGNPESGTRIDLQLSTNGVPQIAVCNKAGESQIVISVDEDERPKLEVKDRAGQRIWSAP